MLNVRITAELSDTKGNIIATAEEHSQVEVTQKGLGKDETFGSFKTIVKAYTDMLCNDFIGAVKCAVIKDKTK